MLRRLPGTAEVSAQGGRAWLPVTQLRSRYGRPCGCAALCLFGRVGNLLGKFHEATWLWEGLWAVVPGRLDVGGAGDLLRERRRARAAVEGARLRDLRAHLGRSLRCRDPGGLQVPRNHFRHRVWVKI